MALKWNCLEPLTAIGIGVGACAIAPLDAGLTAGAVIGGAGLFSRLKQNSRKAGLDDEKLVARVQKKLVDELKHWDQAEERAAAERADAAMQTLLPQVMLRRDQLAATVTQARKQNERYPVLAARLVVDELARHDPMFEQPRAGAPQRYERVFALEAVEAALRSGMNDPEYATLLTLDIAIELGAAIRETTDAVQSLHEEVDAGFARQEELAEASERRFDRLEAMLSEKLGVPLEVISREIAAILELKPAASEAELYDDLRSFKGQHDRLRARVAQIETFDNQLTALKSEADEALARYDHDRAAALYRKARSLIDERTAERARQGTEFARAEAEAWMLERNWQAAAQVWRDSAHKLAPFDAKAAGDLLNTAGIALSEFGTKYGDLALEAAIASFRAALEMHMREDLPVDWAMTQNNLGLSLRTQGERLGGQAGMGLLREAVAAFRAALEMHTREDLPVDWAKTQNNLGIALAIQGMRLGGQTGIDLLGEAVAAYRQALEVHTREDLPVEWAGRQNNLGLALATQGERLGGQAGIALLGEAVAAYRQALEVYTSEDLPVDWAMTQNNLGLTLATQGERLGGQAGMGLLREAVSAFRQALDVYTRDDLPVDWAMTQTNLGSALQTQGERMSGQAGLDLLGQAVAVYRQALEVQTRDNLPVDWAMTQTNLGTALQTQGERLGGQAGIDLLGEAIAAYRQALEVYTRDDLPVYWAMTQNNLGGALQIQGERLGGQAGIDLLGEAVAAYRQALEVRTRDALPVDWAMTQTNLGIALRTQGERLGGQAGIDLLGEAVAAYRAALEVRTRDDLPVYWAITQNNLGTALRTQGARVGGHAGIDLLGEAVAACRQALEVHTREDLPVQWAMTKGNMGLAFEDMADLSEHRRCKWLSDARTETLASLEVFTADALSRYHALATETLSRIEAKIAEHCSGD